jgi:hypothetical protein
MGDKQQPNGNAPAPNTGSRLNIIKQNMKDTDIRLEKIEKRCITLEETCANTYKQLQYLTSMQEAAQTDNGLIQKQSRTTENMITCDTLMVGSMALYPQLLRPLWGHLLPKTSHWQIPNLHMTIP